MVNITKETEKYISKHPSVKDCLKKGLVNYSSLSREISRELGLDKKDFDAVLVASRRYFRKIQHEKSSEGDVTRILKNSKLEVKNKIITIVVEKDIFTSNLLEFEKEIKEKKELFQMIEGTNTITFITSEDFEGDVKELFGNKIIRITKDLVEIMLKSPPEIETTPGVIAYLYSLFGEHGINIVETMSCYTDTLFVIHEDDLGKMVGLMKF